MSGDGVKGRGINGRGPRSGKAPVYAAKAREADATSTLPVWGWGKLCPQPLPRGERGVWGGAPWTVLFALSLRC